MSFDRTYTRVDSPFTLPIRLATLLPNKFASLLSRSIHTPQSPPPTIKRRRRTLGLWSSAIDPQTSSPFLSRLPAELRNEIYTYVFKSNTPSPNPYQPPHHPLPLLLTCRLINSEAAVLAFRSHTFHLSGDISFHGLRSRTTHLPAALFDSISSVSCTPWPDTRYKSDRKSSADVVADVLVLFPHVAGVHVTIGREGHLREAWNAAVLDRVERSVWGKWRLLDPDGVEEAGDDARVGCWRTSRTGEVSVHVFEDGETGRRARVSIEGGARIDYDAPGLGRLGLRLSGGGRREGVRDVRTKTGALGLEFDPGEEYWGELRNRRVVEERGELDRGRDEELPGYWNK
ncbi:hypothetical protein DE146DRAFT_420917 [Phaeosphaeria sp. MPI-PUGE-AT-0046c]|nr:hypothetical protein DE146DRAFT_420917 [Phaeosphaeria sp. MPI-PUGE-AT-0046c]